MRCRRMRMALLYSDRTLAGDAMTRRAFLKTAAVPLLAAACRRPPFDARDFHRLDRSPVTMLPAGGYDADFAALIGRGLADLGVDVRGRRVFLKPNMVEYEAGTAINT